MCFIFEKLSILPCWSLIWKIVNSFVLFWGIGVFSSFEQANANNENEIIFEVPNKDGNLTSRLKDTKTGRYLKVIKQIQVEDKQHLNRFLKKVEQKGGEGVVVRDGSLLYYTGRGDSALKVKSYIDDECEVVGYNSGHGKYEGMTGSLSCRMKNMQIIKIGSGLSEHQRAVPPNIGSIVTFKYYGLTSKGNPRFPIFLRVRD